MAKTEKQHSIEEVKEQVINTSLIVAAIIGSVAFLTTSISRFTSTGFNLSSFFEGLVLLTLIFATIFRKRISNTLKALLLVSLILFLSLTDAFFYGLLSSTRIYLVLIPFFSIIYFPFRRSVILYALGIVGFIFIGFLHSRELVLIPTAYEPNLYMLRFYPWIINAIHITTVSAVILLVTRKFFLSFSGLIEHLKVQNIKISENERNYREIFNSTNEAIFIHNASDSKILDVNDIMLKMFGCSRKDEVLKLCIKDISANNDFITQERAQLLIRKAVEEGPQIFEWKNKRQNGEEFFSEISLKSTEIGGEGRVLAVLRDITDRKLIEQKLKDSEEQYRNLVETSQDGISLMDMNGIMLFVNSRKAQMVGVDNVIELVGQNAYNYLTNESIAKVSSLMPNIIEHGYINNLEAEVRRFDGSIFQAEFNVTILKDSSGKPKYMMDTMRDITLRKQTEQALKESEENYRTLIENVNEVIMVVDNNDKVRFVNKKFTEKLGYTSSEIVGKIGYKALINPNYQELIVNQNKRRIEGSPSQYEITFTSKSGKEIDFLVSGAPIKDSNGKVIGSIGAMTDITEKNKTAKELEKYRNHLEALVQERTEELAAANEELTANNELLYNQRLELQEAITQLQKAQKQLIQSEKMASLGVLASGVAHEINNPLNFIHGSSNAIENYFKSNIPEKFDEVSELLDIINIGVKRAADIVKTLSHFSRKQERATTLCDIHSIIDNCLLILSSKMGNRISLVKDYVRTPISINCNKGGIHQALLNILTNSVQAISNEGVVKVTTNARNDFLIINITDSGCGINKRNLHKVTDPFFTTKDQGEGTGLGLSITQSIIEEHKGNLEIDSEEGKGTKVFVYLPIQK